MTAVIEARGLTKNYGATRALDDVTFAVDAGRIVGLIGPNGASKGMVTQLHLALVLAIDARLLVLDEPTLGLDLLYRRNFYDTILNDYFDKERTILLTTHQVEEVENLFTDVIFINHGRVALSAAVEDLGSRYQQLTPVAEQAARARALQPFYEREVFGRVAMFFEGRSAAELGAFGELRTPSIADLFVAKMQGTGSP